MGGVWFGWGYSIVVVVGFFGRGFLGMARGDGWIGDDFVWVGFLSTDWVGSMSTDWVILFLWGVCGLGNDILR